MYDMYDGTERERITLVPYLGPSSFFSFLLVSTLQSSEVAGVVLFDAVGISGLGEH